MERELLRPGERLDDLQRNGFQVIQHPDAFRFGTDSVLLADFARPAKRDVCVDLGCGTGAIALMLLARQPEIAVTGVEIQPHAADMARRSARINGVEQRFRVLEGDMREIYRKTGRGVFSLAVCNPPYFKEGGALKNPDPALRTARHEGDLSPGELCAAAARLLKFGGRFAVIYPAPRALEMLRAMEEAGIAPKRLRTVQGIAGKPPKHVLMDGIRGAGPGLHWMEPLILKDENGDYTPEWHRIYGM